MLNFIQIGLQDSVEYSFFCGESDTDVRVQYLNRIYSECQSPTRESHFVPRYLMEAIDWQPMRVIGVEIDADSVARVTEGYATTPNLHIWHAAVRPEAVDEIDTTLDMLISRVNSEFDGDVWGLAMSMNGGELAVLQQMTYKPVFLDIRSPEEENAQALLEHILAAGYRIFEKVEGNVTQIRADCSDVSLRRW